MDINIDDIKLIIRTLAAEYNRASRIYRELWYTYDPRNMSKCHYYAGIMEQSSKTLQDFEKLKIAGTRLSWGKLFVSDDAANGRTDTLGYVIAEVTFDGEN